jgi:hypothetical protein
MIRLFRLLLINPKRRKISHEQEIHKVSSYQSLIRNEKRGQIWKIFCLHI